MRKPLGSEVFGTLIIRADEALLMAKTMQDNGENPESTMIQIEAFDDLLSALRLRSVSKVLAFTKNGNIRKDASFSSIVNNRIDKLVNDLSHLKACKS